MGSPFRRRHLPVAVMVGCEATSIGVAQRDGGLNNVGLGCGWCGGWCGVVWCGGTARRGMAW
eukprot:5641-Prorocentrum_lima.AAC.1